MSWLASFLVAVLSSATAVVVGGVVASACVDWYRIPGREGASGYFVVIIALLSGLGGFLVGFVLSRFTGGPGSGGFFKGLGISIGAMVSLGAVAAGIAWLLADIPPKIGGRELDLEVEVRLPKEASLPVVQNGKPCIFFESRDGAGQAARASESGALDVTEAREENGRWIIPGSVSLFTTRGRRVLTVALDQTHTTGFEVPFPGHPGAQYEQWSGWLPSGNGGKPWPDSEMSYRFRIEPKKTPEEMEAVTVARYAALRPDAPIERWFKYLSNGSNPERDKAIAKVLEGRSADLARCLRSTDLKEYTPALYIVNLQEKIDPQVAQAMRDIASDMVAKLRQLNGLPPASNEYSETATDVYNRFLGWSNSWGHVCRAGKLDCMGPLKTIIELAGSQNDNYTMRQLVSVAQATLSNLTPPPTMPQ